jgi:2-polyprenyl-3-methyl-5-hydroxy-6-metoxy-1,4-benzoquinol methylase
MNNLAPQSYWDTLYSTRTFTYFKHSVPLRPILDRLFPNNGHLFEIGCYPGQFLIYLGTEKRLTVSGIDATPRVKMLSHILPTYGVVVGEIIHGDFFHTRFVEQYDIVCSFGFIEHFPNLRDVLSRHAELVKPGGLLFISTPNFRWLQYVLHAVFDRANLARHCVANMSTSKWHKIVAPLGFDLIDRGFCGTCEFWVEPEPRTALAAWLVERVKRRLLTIDRAINWPNRFLSPYMYAAWRRRKL